MGRTNSSVTSPTRGTPANHTFGGQSSNFTPGSSSMASPATPDQRSRTRSRVSRLSQSQRE